MHLLESKSTEQVCNSQDTRQAPKTALASANHRASVQIVRKRVGAPGTVLKVSKRKRVQAKDFPFIRTELRLDENSGNDSEIDDDSDVSELPFLEILFLIRINKCLNFFSQGTEEKLSNKWAEEDRKATDDEAAILQLQEKSPNQWVEDDNKTANDEAAKLQLQ